jgi:hypothetical protein
MFLLRFSFKYITHTGNNISQFVWNLYDVFVEDQHSRTEDTLSVYDIVQQPEVIVCEAISSQSTVHI